MFKGKGRKNDYNASARQSPPIHPEKHDLVKKVVRKTTSSSFSEAVIAWHEQHGRKDLPWQLDNSPYHTWLSEIMLQQTQVQTVIPYYQQFKSRFPTIEALATAHVDEVLHLWAGLGYYSRARNLHQCAQIIHNQYKGKFPQTLEALQALPGIGRSTAGAIVSLSMNKAAPILDGNVKRVFCRFHCIEGWSGETKAQQQLWQLAEQHLPKENAKAYNQSLMDLGATICTRSKPRCEICPLAPRCACYERKAQKDFPKPKPKKIKPIKHCFMLILQKPDGSVYLQQRPSAGIWGGLWSLPQFDDETQLKRFLSQYPINAKTEELPEVKHIFTHYQLNISPLLCRIKREPARIAQTASLWYNNEHKVGLPAPVKKLIQHLPLQERTP